MLKCIKDVGVSARHFSKKPSEPVVSVKAGDIVSVKKDSEQVLLDSGYFEVVEKKAPKAEEVVEEISEGFESGVSDLLSEAE